MKKTHCKTMAAALAVGLLAGACGGDDGDAATRAAIAEPTAAVEVDSSPAGSPPEATGDAAADADTTDGAEAEAEGPDVGRSEPAPASPICVPTQSPRAEVPAGVVIAFDREVGQLSEGLAIDVGGNILLSFSPLGQLLRVEPGSDTFEVVGSVPDWTGEGLGLLGLAIDDAGDVYAAAQSAGSTGVWRFECGAGEPTLVEGTDALGIPNSLVFDGDGTLFVTDSNSGADGDQALGAIWRIGTDGSVTKWLEDPMLGGTDPFGLGPTGANGIDIHDGTLVVATTDTNQILAVDVGDDGTPGPIRVLAEAPLVFAPDGLAIDERGDIYIAMAGPSAVALLTPDGVVQEVAQGAKDGLDLPADVAFASRADGSSVIYATNVALFPDFGTGIGPALVAVDPLPTS